MKAKLRLPLEQYAFAEIEAEGTAEEVRDAYEELKNAFREEGEGLERKDWNKALDRYLAESKMDSEMYESMSAGQQRMIQEIKKSIKRTISKLNK